LLPLLLTSGFRRLFTSAEHRVALRSQSLRHGVISLGRLEQGRDGERHRQAGILDPRAGLQGPPTPALGSPFTDLPALDEDRKDPPHAAAVHDLGFLPRLPLVLFGDHLEGDLLQEAATSRRIDPLLVQTGVAGEVRVHRMAREKVDGGHVAGGLVRPQDIMKLAVLVGVRRMGGVRDHAPAADDLVARDFRHDEMIVHPWEGLTARQA